MLQYWSVVLKRVSQIEQNFFRRSFFNMTQNTFKKQLKNSSPSLSPNLNPMEHFRVEAKRKITNILSNPAIVQNLFTIKHSALFQKFIKISPRFLFIATMPLYSIQATVHITNINEYLSDFKYLFIYLLRNIST